MRCPVCDTTLQQGGLGQTLLGVDRRGGHFHDPNRFSLGYSCPCRVHVSIPFRVRCPKDGCDWKSDRTGYLLEEIP